MGYTEQAPTDPHPTATDTVHRRATAPYTDRYTPYTDPQRPNPAVHRLVH